MLYAFHICLTESLVRLLRIILGTFEQKQKRYRFDDQSQKGPDISVAVQ